MKFFNQFLFIAGVVSCVYGQQVVKDDSDNSTAIVANNVRVKILGHSGKMSIRRQGNSTDGAVIEFDSIIERDANGEEVGKQGQNKHSLNSFASQEISFGSITVVDVGNTTADSIDFVAKLDNNATLKIYTYLIRTDGYVNLNGTDYFLEAGSFKFNVEIESWPFCLEGGTGVNLCENGNTNEVGEMLDFTIAIRGKHEPRRHNHTEMNGQMDDSGNKMDGKERGGKRPGANAPLRNRTDFELGSDVLFVAPNVYTVDDVWYSMPDTYPMLELKGSKSLITLRFSRFEGKKLIYDPVVSGIQGSDNTINSAIASSASIFLSLFAAAFFMVF